MPHFTVSLSGNSLGDCHNVLKFMQASGMSGDVTRNLSMTKSGKVEPGCRIFVVDSSITQVRKFFDGLRREHPELECAHVRSVHDEMEGCIYNVCEAETNNKCPQFLKRCGGLKAEENEI